MTEVYLQLRICERFGQSPDWFESQSAGRQALLLEFERVRQLERARELAAP